MVHLPELSCVRIRSRDNDGSNHHEPVGYWYVDLSVKGRSGVDHLDLGEVGHSHDLRQQLEDARDDGLRCHDGGQYRQDQ